MRKVPIKLHTASALKWLGSLYRNPAEAIKEHITNAVDEHLKAQRAGQALPICEVTFKLEKERITICYPYGMSEKEFESALQRVADSVKKEDIEQIGELGIGMFSFIQIGKKCTFFSKKDQDTQTIRVTLKEDFDIYELDMARKREDLGKPGIKIIISNLKLDPTKSRGPLSPERLKKVFAKMYDSYLKDGWLSIVINQKGKKYSVEPLQIKLPRVGEAFKNYPLTRDRDKTLSLELYFEPSGNGKVSMRHKGVVIVDDIKTMQAYSLEESVYANGDLMGFIDADFLNPLPSRTGFEQNNDWMNLLDELYIIGSTIEAEVEDFKQDEAEKRLTEIQKKVIELANEILYSEEFKDLELLEGLGKKPREPKYPPNGFDFVPSSVRIEQGKIRTLPLKAFVPDKVPDNSVVKLYVNDDSVELKSADRIILKASEVNEDGLVSVSVSLLGKSKTVNYALLTAITGKLKAEARIRVAEAIQTREPKGPGKEKEGSRINYVEKSFEEGPKKHSRYMSESRQIEINKLNDDFKQEVTNGTEQTQIAYAALMIGKETIAFNDKRGGVDEFLEKLLTFHFILKNKLGKLTSRKRKKFRKRPKSGS
ncbi:ATP-binding protein [bacterium]|nr:ATP-binding protein [bacterium]